MATTKTGPRARPEDIVATLGKVQLGLLDDNRAAAELNASTRSLSRWRTEYAEQVDEWVERRKPLVERAISLADEADNIDDVSISAAAETIDANELRRQLAELTSKVEKLRIVVSEQAIEISDLRAGRS